MHFADHEPEFRPARVDRRLVAKRSRWRNLAAPSPLRRPHSLVHVAFIGPVLWVLACARLLAAPGAAAGSSYVPASLAPPDPPREFRAAWVASVKNIDWPSRPGLPVAQQQAELNSLLDTAARLHFNAIILQVRTACDALYSSKLEPWSEYLTGRMGQAPSPWYDPLAFAVTEAHRRGLELHAWFNPYRARHTSAFSPIARQHISRTHPELVKTYGTQLWLDPARRDVQDLSLRVVLDVVNRYDIDGVHFDDYFYPYPEKDAHQQPIPFPDWASWTKYRQAGGQLARDDWRRDNVTQFLRRVATEIKQRKPWVKFGISPFGIWRPGNPAPIRGLDAYSVLYADARQWLADGICDYLAPQLYWPTDRAEQSFPVLLRWWRQQNVRHRHLWPGLAHANGPTEILSQIRQSREQASPHADGQFHWSMSALTQNRKGIADLIARDAYTTTALTPAYPWLKSAPLAQPRLEATPRADGGVRFGWSLPTAPPAWQWIVQHQHGGKWVTEILGGTIGSLTFTAAQGPDALAIRAVDRCGNASPPAGLRNSLAAPH